MRSTLPRGNRSSGDKGSSPNRGVRVSSFAKNAGVGGGVPTHAPGSGAFARLRGALRGYDLVFSTSTSVLPIRAGEGDTVMPAASMAAIFDSASPFPPEMIAPA